MNMTCTILQANYQLAFFFPYNNFEKRKSIEKKEYMILLRLKKAKISIKRWWVKPVTSSVG